MTAPAIHLLRNRLKALADEEIKVRGQRYFKDSIESYGVKNPVVNRISKETFREIRSLDKMEIFNLIEILWQSGILEESLVACNWTYSLHSQFAPADFNTFRHWISRYVNNWAACDSFCNHSVGEFIEMYPDYRHELTGFTTSDNKWMRRSAAVSFIIPARKGLYLETVFEIAGRLLTDPEDLVQKGYGWMLKAASEARQKEVFDFVMKRKSEMPRTALRYAIEKMPAELRSRAMSK
jgi:3-methyladenine DNA glycosylase AlkD